jgi:hypothetical protein
MRLPGVVALLLSTIGGTLTALPGPAHPRALNAEGYHNNRKTGGFLCHRDAANCSQARAVGAAPVRVGIQGTVGILIGMGTASDANE